MELDDNSGGSSGNEIPASDRRRHAEARRRAGAAHRARRGGRVQGGARPRHGLPDRGGRPLLRVRVQEGGDHHAHPARRHAVRGHRGRRVHGRARRSAHVGRPCTAGLPAQPRAREEVRPHRGHQLLRLQGRHGLRDVLLGGRGRARPRVGTLGAAPATAARMPRVGEIFGSLRRGAPPF